MDKITSVNPTITPDTNASILIADDDPRILITLKLLLKSQYYQVVAVNSPAELLTVLARRSFSVALIDLNYQHDTTSGKEGLTLISKMKALDEHMPIVVMTGYSSVDIAVNVMKEGAADLGLSPQALTLDSNGIDSGDFDSNSDTLEVIERQIIVDRLARFNNNSHETAASLGLSRSAYYRRIEKHKL